MDAPAGIEQQVVCVQVRMKDASLVKASHARAHLAPGVGGNSFRLSQQGRKRKCARDALGDQVTTIEQARTPVPGGHRCGNRQARRVQLVQQSPLAKGARARLAGPQVPVIQYFRDRAAASVVAQHPRAFRRLDESGAASPRLRALDRRARAPPVAAEEVLARVARARGVI